MCIQQAQRFRGFLALADDELEMEIIIWHKATASIPDDELESVFDFAASRHNWAEPFRVGNLTREYLTMLEQQRLQTEAEFKDYKARLQDAQTRGVYLCRKCSDTGWTVAHRWQNPYNAGFAWQRGVRPCSCEAAPAIQRTAPLEFVDGNAFSVCGKWARNTTGELCPVADLIAAKRVPGSGWQAVAEALNVR